LIVLECKLIVSLYFYVDRIQTHKLYL